MHLSSRVCVCSVLVYVRDTTFREKSHTTAYLYKCTVQDECKLGKLMRKKKGKVQKLSIDDIIHFDALKQRSAFLYMYIENVHAHSHMLIDLCIYTLIFNAIIENINEKCICASQRLISSKICCVFILYLHHI